MFRSSALRTVSKEMIEVLVDDPRKGQLLQEGGGYAAIFGPDGKPLAKPLPEKEEGIIYADVDLGMISLAKAAGDPVGHYSRPDVLRLLMNPAPAPRVEYYKSKADLVEVRGTLEEAKGGARESSPLNCTSAFTSGDE